MQIVGIFINVKNLKHNNKVKDINPRFEPNKISNNIPKENNRRKDRLIFNVIDQKYSIAKKIDGELRYKYPILEKDNSSKIAKKDNTKGNKFLLKN